MTEAETKVLQSTAERTAQTQYHEPRPTGPSYLAPNDPALPQPPASADSESPRLGRHGVLWAGAILIVVILVAALGMAAFMLKRPVSTSVTRTAPEAPPATGIVPPVPPEAPQPPTSKTGNTSGLIYPGAEVTMEMTRGVEGSVRQLRTKDSFEKVVAWYTEKLKPEKTVKAGGSAVLKGDNTTAVITSEDGDTTILLKEGIDQ